MLKFRPLNFVVVCFVRLIFQSVSFLDKVFHSNKKLRDIKIKTGLLLLSVSFIVSSCNSNEETGKNHENNLKKADDGIAKNLRMPLKKRLSKMIWVRPMIILPEPIILCYDIGTTSPQPTEPITLPVDAPFDYPDEYIVDFAEVQPVFPGGDIALIKFLQDEVKYPEYAKENEITGTVYCKFVIEKDGKVSNITVLRGVEPSLDNEAKRVIGLLPAFTPGKVNGNPVRVSYALPIKFKFN